MKTYTLVNNYIDKELKFEALYFDYSKGEKLFQFYTYDTKQEEIITKVFPVNNWLIWNVEEI